MAEKRPVVANLGYGGEYRAQLEAAARTGQCPFCNGVFQSEGVLERFAGWFIRQNAYPSRDIRDGHPEHHFLIVSVKHEVKMGMEDWAAVGWLVDWVCEKFGITGGGLCIRLGDPIRSGRTILHPHAHFIVPRLELDAENPDKQKAVYVNFPIG